MGTIFCGEYLFTGDGKACKDWALYVADGMIQAVGPKEELCASYPDAELTQKPHWLILPAFRDAHDHGRGVSPVAFGAPDCALEAWIPGLSCVRSDAYLSALYDGLLLATSGVSTVLHSHNPAAWGDMQELVDTARGYNDAGIRVVLCPPYVDQNNLVYQQREKFLASLTGELHQEFEQRLCDDPVPLEDYFGHIQWLTEQLSDRIASGMVSIQLHPSGFQWCSDECLCAMQSFAEKRDLRIHMHMLETKYQRAYAQEKWGNSGVKHLDELGILTPRLSLAHMVWTDDEDWELLKKRGVTVVTNASSNLRLHSGVIPLYKVIEAGVPCGVGLDGCALDDDQDFLRELRLVGLNPSVSGISAGITPEMLVRMGTQGSASALCLGGNGRIEAGQPADFVCIDLQHLRSPFSVPHMDPVELLLLRGSCAAVDCLYVSGKKVVEGGGSCRFDLEEVGERFSQVLFEKTKDIGDSAMSPSLRQAIKEFYLRIEQNGGIHP